MALPKRTAKDEAEYNAHLRREEPIKTEIIQQLRADNKVLLTNQQRLLTNLLLAQQDLATYRAEKIASAEMALATGGVSGFYWDNVDGWHRKGE